ncbi:hypothetical protein Sjap_012765 [Stephania japonica]|uniref:WAT1-related protein n=1 Tax=Stephania japonica TaxID=461633 RepID=A0AAP0IWR9_9MAGN
MELTTATFTSAMCNMLPALTFFLAYILRESEHKKGPKPSQAKILGTLVSIGGAMIMTLIKGPILKLFWTKGSSRGNESGTSEVKHDLNFIKGAIIIVVALCSWASFIILQLSEYGLEAKTMAFFNGSQGPSRDFLPCFRSAPTPLGNLLTGLVVVCVGQLSADPGTSKGKEAIERRSWYDQEQGKRGTRRLSLRLLLLTAHVLTI